MFKEVRQSKVTQKIFSQIRTAILEGKLQPGDKLPSEKELVEQFQVSKQTLRESLRALEHMGLIDVRKGIGGGAFIVEVNIEIAKESLANYLYFKNLTIDNLSEFRLLIEPAAARMAAQNISNDELRALDLLNQSARQNLRMNRIRDAARDEFNFHLFIADLTKNPILILCLDFVESMLDDFKSVLKPDRAFFETVLDAHDRIYMAIKDRNAALAQAEMLAHVEAVGDHLRELHGGADFSRIYVNSN
jgi:GntR family transcriptional repressor for pyruvate dehydrogenase complex